MSNGKIILDTNIVSYLMKGGPLAEAYEPSVQNHLLARCRKVVLRPGGGLRIASLIHLHKSPTKAKTVDRTEKIRVETMSRFVLFPLRFPSSTSS